jgi:hypothetical protein
LLDLLLELKAVFLLLSGLLNPALITPAHIPPTSTTGFKPASLTSWRLAPALINVITLMFVALLAAQIHLPLHPFRHSSVEVLLGVSLGLESLNLSRLLWVGLLEGLLLLMILLLIVVLMRLVWNRCWL